MIHTAALLIATCLLSAGTSPEDEHWRALPLPALCQEPVVGARLPVLEFGRHVLQPGDDLAQRSPGAAPHLPIPMLLGLLSDEAARLGLAVEFQPTAPPLLARGKPAELDTLEALLGDLDRAGRALDVDVRAWFTEGATDAGAYPSATALAAAVGGRAPWAAARVRSGADVVLGARETQSFVMTYNVELATDSGVADPVLGSVLVGRTLHLTASRAQGGNRIHVEGFLDLSELLALDSFDTQTYDLGLVQQPRVGVVQLAFSGSVASEGALAVSFAGAPLGLPDQTLWLQLACEPDAPATGAWRGLDVALLEHRCVSLPVPHPGAGLTGVELPGMPRVLSEPLPASALAQAFSRDAGRNSSVRPVWTRGYLLAPAADAGWSEVEDLVAVTHAARAPGGTLTLTHGSLRAQLPLAERVPARLLVGVETTLLSEYDAAVAAEVWLPEPVIEPVFDGLLVQGALERKSFRGIAWTTLSQDAVTVGRAEVGLGRFQLSRRTFQAARCEVEAGAGAATLLQGRDAAGSATLTTTLEAR